MAKSHEEIVALFESNDAATNKLGVLRDALDTLKEAWSANEQTKVAAIAEKIADAARSSSWRVPVGESGVLEFFLGLAQSSGGHVVQTLRVIGNACVDCNENREIVVASGRLPNIVGLLNEDKLVQLVLLVIFNICVDSVAAQNQAYEAGFSSTLVDIIDGPRLAPIREDSLGRMIKALELLEASKNTEPTSLRPAAATRLLDFLAREMATNLGIEDFTGLCTVILAYLSHGRFQEHMVASGGMPTLLQVLAYSSGLEVDPEDPGWEDEEVLEQRETNRAAFAQIIGKISEPAAFFEKCGPGTATFDLLVDKFLPNEDPHLQLVACVCLGNLCTSAGTSIAVGSDERVRDRLITIVARGAKYLGVTSTPSPSIPGVAPAKTTAEPLQAVYQALSCLKNLSIPVENKPKLGHLLDNTLPHYWTASSAFQQEIQSASVSLARLLVTNCPTNVKRMVVPGVDPSSHDIRTRLQLLIDLLPQISAEGPAAVRTKTDIYRAVCAVCRMLLCYPVAETKPTDYGYKALESGVVEDTRPEEEQWLTLEERGRFQQTHPAVMNVLGQMLAEIKIPAIRAEVLFVLATVSREETGVAQAALAALEKSVVNLAALGDCVLGDGKGEELLREFWLWPPSGGDTSSETSQSQEESSGGVVRVDRDDGTTTTALPEGVQDMADSMNRLLLDPMNPAAAIEQTPSQPPSVMIAKVVRENGIVLASEVSRRFPDALSPAKRKVYEAIVNGGLEIVRREYR